MARRSDGPNVLDELESQGDVLAAWLQRNARTAIAVVAGSLLLAAGYAGLGAWSEGRENEAANALAEVEADFVRELGGSLGSIELPELANPEAGRAIRQEYLDRFRAVAEAHAGTTAGALARLREARLLLQQGDSEAAAAALRTALDGIDGGSPLRPLLLEQLAQAHERAGAWAEAAEAYAEAGSHADYALRHWALAEAARCFAAAGQREHALELFDRIQSEAPELTLPSHVRELARELRAGVTPDPPRPATSDKMDYVN